MQLHAILATSLLSALVTAIPTPDLAPRSCTIQLPTTYQQISEDYPKKYFPQNRFFNVSQSAGGLNAVDTLIHFTGIPAGAYACQLNAKFTYDYSIPSSGSTQLNFYPLQNDIKPTDTYYTYFPQGGNGTPKGSFLWGTTTLTGQPVTINSEVCASSLSFLVKIASDTAPGSVQFQDAGNNLSGIGGFYLTYSC